MKNFKVKAFLPICIALIVTICALGLAACNKSGTAADMLAVGTTMTVDSLNRLASTGGDSGYNYLMLSSTLAQVPLVYSEGGRVSSVLCDISVSDDGLKYTFALKDGFKWHDGKDVTVDDLLFTLQSSLGGETAELQSGAVAVTLKKPQARFLDSLLGVLIMPKHLLEGETASTITDEKSVIGCGPFKFIKRNIEAGTVEFEKFDGYPYADRVSFKKVVFRCFGSEDTMRLALKAGEIDIIWNYGYGLNADGASDFEKAGGIKLETYTVKAVPKVLFFNNAKLTDTRVKRAIRKAIDYEKIGRIFGTKGASLPREGFVAPDIFGYAQTAQLTRDLAGARALLKEAGYSEDNKFDFELLVRADNNDTQYADLIKTDLEETGLISVKLKSIAGAQQWQAYYRAGSHMASLASVTEAGYGFEAGYATRYLLAADNYVMRDSFPQGNPVCHGNIDIGTPDDLTEFGGIRQALADAKNLDELSEAAAAYQNYIVDNAPCIALLYDSKVQALSKKLEGYRVDATFGILNVQGFVTMKKAV